MSILVTLTTLGALAWAGNRALSRWAWQRLDLPVTPRMATPPSLKASACAACHASQYAQWKSSRMGQTMTDPIFLADWHAQDDSFVCLPCHAPLMEQRPWIVTGLASVVPLRPLGKPNPDFDPVLQGEGVTCVVCHPLDRRDLGSGAERCEPCHQVPIPPLAFRLDRPLADTHREWEVWQAQGHSETCADCHMPDAQHTFPGAFDVDLLRSGLNVDVEVLGDSVRVQLTNLAGHRFPTADPARALVIRHGAAEEVIARRVPLPRYIDAGDNTLLPGEVRSVTLSRTPGADVVVTMEPVRFLDVAPEPVSIEIARITHR